jgi:adhesin/invasin
MEVPAKFKSVFVGLRYSLLAFLIVATSAFLISCGNEKKTVTIIAEDIGSIILTIEENPLVAGGVTTTIVTAEVFKFNGEPVPNGTVVQFVVTPIGNITESVSTNNGIAIALLTSDTAAGQYKITASAGDAGQIAFGEFIPGLADNTNTSLSANPNSIPADGTSTSQISLLAKDINGNPVADDTLVNFYTTHGTLSDATGVTANGVATVELTSVDGNGVVANLTAVVDGITKTISVGMGAALGNGTGTASYIELTVSEYTIRVKNSGGQENSVISAIAFDETGSPITDFANNIRFSIESGPNGGEELDGSLLPVTKSTANGTASVSLTSGTVSGTVRIKVEVILDGTGSGVGAPFATALTTPIAIEAGEPANIIIFQDTLVTPNNDGSTSRTLSALAQDLHGNPVENGTVIFFGLVDNPDLAGPPYLGYISAGANGSTNGTVTFSSAGNSFNNDGLIDDDLLIILEGQDEGGHRIKSVDSNTALTLYNMMNGSESGLDFVAGFAELGSICGSVQTGNLEMDSSCTPTTVGGAGSIKGVAHTKLTWVPQGIFKPFYLYAESVGGDVGDTLAGTYPAVTDLKITVTIIPDSVLSGTTDIFVEAEYKDGSDNPIQGEIVTFTTSNPLLANFGGAPATTDETNSVGKASTNDLDTQQCLDSQSTVTITAAIGSYAGEATLAIQPTAPTAIFTCTDTGDGNNADCSDVSTTVSGTTITDWSWDVGCNGSEESSDADPILTLGPGTTEVCLTVTNDLGCSDSNIEVITLGAGAPTAAFSYTDNTDGTASFTDQSTAAPGTTNDTWAWTFPAGTVPASSSLQNPTNVAFTGPGPHSVTLAVTNDFGVSDSVTQSVTVSSPIVANFSINNGANDGTAILTDTSTSGAPITNWQWTLPAGAALVSGTLTSSSITVDFAGISGTPGSSPAFDVTLQVTNSFAETDSITQAVTVTDAPTASFTSSPIGPPADGSSVLDGAGSSTPGGNTLTYQWTLPVGATTGDALTSSSITVDFGDIVGTPGTPAFNVTLEVTNNFSETGSNTQAITVSDLLPSPPTFSDADQGDGTSILTSTSNTTTGGKPVTYQWTLPLGATTSDALTSASITVDFSGASNNGTPGDFNVVLELTNNFGATSTTGPTAVTVTAAAPTVTPSITLNTPGNCQVTFNETTTFTESTGVSWDWTFTSAEDIDTASASFATSGNSVVVTDPTPSGDFTVNWQLDVTDNFGVHSQNGTTASITCPAP